MPLKEKKFSGFLSKAARRPSLVLGVIFQHFILMTQLKTNKCPASLKIGTQCTWFFNNKYFVCLWWHIFYVILTIRAYSWAHNQYTSFSNIIYMRISWYRYRVYFTIASTKSKEPINQNYYYTRFYKKFSTKAIWTRAFHSQFHQQQLYKSLPRLQFDIFQQLLVVAC